ncbi:O-antigen ligase family protein [Bacteroides pyogenes]|uniref:O-antigen ligase family protein n=1 Tax=Bacteroides pyogenes TaxID=310300 RepID=UPI0011E4C027|nr:hypothetical protein [Bacteroides pyogenes]TYK37819.1 hypothetical protein FNJ61_06295 [Bacteroides pyogenes]
MVTKYNGEKIFLFTICGIGILDAVVTMGQILFIPSINNLVSYLQLDLALKEEFGLIQGRADFGLGFGIPGVFGVVANSYYLMVASILSMSAQTKKLSLIGLLITSFLLVACFVVQERSSFYLATTFVIILAFVLLTKLFGKFTRLFILFIFLLLLSLLIDKGADYINSFETRMSDMFSLTGRDAIWANAIDYISQYPIFAGYDRMMSIYHRDAHNLILNAYIFGGLFGFIAIIVLTVRQFILIAKSCLLRCKINNLTVMVLSCTFIAYTVNSLVHNFSVVYGTLDIWLVWACLYSIVKRERQPYSSNGSYLTQ